MNSCSRSAEAAEYLLGLMDGPTESSFLRHVEGCPECARALEAEKDIDSCLADSYEVPDGLLERIGTSIDLLEKPSGRLARARILGIACASSAALFGLWSLATSSGRAVVSGDRFHDVIQSVARIVDSGAVGLLGLGFGIVLTVATMLALAARYGR